MSTTLEIIRSNARGIPAGYSHLIDRAASAVDAQPNRSPREVIEEIMRSNGLGMYMSYATPIITALEASRSVEVTAPVAEGTGFDTETCAATLRQFARSKGANMTEVEEVLREAGLSPVPFDRDAAALTLAEFAQSKGISGDETQRLLTEVGLVDPVVEEPVAEERSSAGTAHDEAPSWAQHLIRTVESLAGFARQHGFRG